MDDWYLANLVCPLDRTPLRYTDGTLVSQTGRLYPVVEGVPIMLVEEDEPTIDLARSTLDRAHAEAAADARAPRLYLESLGISDVEKDGIMALAAQSEQTVDPVVSYMVGATSGIAYRTQIGRLKEYPIPELRLDAVGTLLDVGCNWGRWSIAAARRGFSVVGIDPSLGAIMAARRVANQLGLPIRYLVADARRLPFRDSSFDNVFSYSVLQHFCRDNARRSLFEIGRVLKPRGTSYVQMPNWLGLRSLYHQARRRFRTPVKFEVRYWSLRELREVFEAEIGSSRISVDCFFGLGLQKSDAHLMPSFARAVTHLSELLRHASQTFPLLTYFADSVYIRSTAGSD